MTVKVTKSLTLKTLIPDIEKNFQNDRASQRKLVNTIRSTIESGKSPVKGERFAQYSKTYADRTKSGRRRPVNMKVSGDMLDSLVIHPTRGSYRLVFENSIADFHNRLGAGKSRVIRRLLPTRRGERFKAFLEKQINGIAEKATNKAVDKQNR